MALGRFLLKRGIQGAGRVGVVTAVFLLRFITPGNPVTFVAPDASARASRARYSRRSLGLDQPLYIQYVDYIGGLLQGRHGVLVPPRD